MALAMLVARRFGDGEATTVWALHKAEVTILEGQQFSSQRCRSWRFAADIYIRQSKQLHIYIPVYISTMKWLDPCFIPGAFF